MIMSRFCLSICTRVKRLRLLSLKTFFARSVVFFRLPTNGVTESLGPFIAFFLSFFQFGIRAVLVKLGAICNHFYGMWLCKFLFTNEFSKNICQRINLSHKNHKC